MHWKQKNKTKRKIYRKKRKLSNPESDYDIERNADQLLPDLCYNCYRKQKKCKNTKNSQFYFDKTTGTDLSVAGLVVGLLTICTMDNKIYNIFL